MNLLSEWIKIIFAALSALYFIVQLFFIKLWRKSVSLKTDSLVLKTSVPKNSKAIIVLILCWALVVFSLITKSTTFICCLMCIVSCLAYYITVREIVYAKLNGIYKNGLVGNGKFIPFEKIKTFPDTSWKEPELQNTISLAIQLKSEKQKKDTLFFIDYASIVEYSKVVNTLKELKQNK